MKKLIALMLIVLLLLAGCTAAAPALDGMQKDREQLLATAASGGVADGSTLREQYDIPEQYKDTYAYPAQGFNGTLTVAVDADIIVPEGNAIPIYRIRAVNFSQEQIDLLWQALIGDTEMWQAATERTKAQILEEITELKELMNDARRLRDRFLLEPGEAEAYLVELEAKYAAAPERLEDIRAYGVLQEIPIYDFENKKVAAYTGFSAREKAEHGKALEVQNNNDVKEMVVVGKDKNGNITSMITPMRNAAFYFHNFAFYNWGTAALSQAEARGTIERLLEQIGGDMIIDRVVDLGYAYSVECARAAGGVPITSSGSWRGQYAIETTGLMETAPYWGYEKLVFEISQEGIADMCWLSPIEITDTAVENAKLLPFFEIQEIFAAMMAVKYAGQQGMFGVANPEAVVQTKAELWEELAELREIIHDADRLRDRRMMTPEEAQEYLIDLEARYAAAPEIAPLPSAELQYVLHFEIDRVTLTLQRIVDEGAYESGLLIPVWNFYDKSSGMSLLCINAIDGTIIEG